jgi:hypothetical protein
MQNVMGNVGYKHIKPSVANELNDRFADRQQESFQSVLQVRGLFEK